MLTPSAYRDGELYSALLSFIREHGEITYPQFDSAIMTELNLFDIPDREYIIAVEQTADQILKALPAFKRIFARPIIRLKDTKEIVPIQAVRLIDNHSLSHASSHSELWENIVDGCIRPRKLMTIEYVESYAIYENIAFACAVDSVLSFVKKTLMKLKDTLYGCRDLHFNFLDRTHHDLYFLAIGKLHLEYSRARASHADISRCIGKLLLIEKTLRLKLSSPVYRKCRRKEYALTLKKTNIFRAHKDYAEIFHILQLFEEHSGKDEQIHLDLSPATEEYKAFCLCLTLFAVGHFHFRFADQVSLRLDPFEAEADFADWHLTMRLVRHETADALLLTVDQERSYTSCLLFCNRAGLTEEKLRCLQEDIEADEYLFCTPNEYGSSDTVYLSIFDIDSFRRIQQIILRGMIYADSKFRTCAFCGNTMSKTDNGYECDVCRAEIVRARCPETGKRYLVSGIRRHISAADIEKGNAERRQFLHDRLNESQFHFRNITPITPDGSPLCPHCGGQHTPEGKNG